MILRYLRTPLDLPIALFVVSALIGVWASYDSAPSWNKFAMIVAAVALYYVLVASRAVPQLLETFVWLFLIGCCALTFYFVTQHDYAAQPGKFGFITAIGLSLNRVAPQLGLHVFDPNITAGALEIGLPLAVALSSSQKSKVKSQKCVSLSPGLLVAVFSMIAIVFGLVMTSSRGAWLALGIVGAIAVMAVVAKDVLRRHALPIGVIMILVGSIALMRLGDAFMPTLENVLGAIPAGDTAISRVELFGQAWGLVQDYNFTGSGLGVFPMILSTYALLIDVPFLTHVHNLFLQVWLEQGLLGFVALMWLVIEFYLWTWRTVGRGQTAVGREQETKNRSQNALGSNLDPLPTAHYLLPHVTEASLPDARVGSLAHLPIGSLANWLAWGGIAAGTVMLLHGMVDVLLYSSRGLPLMLVPFAIAVASQQSTVDNRQKTGHRTQITEGRRQKTEGRGQDEERGKQVGGLKPGTWNLKLDFLLLAVFGLLLLSFILFSSSFQAMWYANIGSVEQTQVELGQYRWPDRLVGNVRKDCGLQMAPFDSAQGKNCRLMEAEQYFGRALALDAGNMTANQRLAAIALAQGLFNDAQVMLGQAYRRDPSNRVTNRLLGLVSKR